MAGSEFFSDRTPQLSKRSQRTLLFVVECQNSSFLADRNKHSERIQPINPADSTKLDVPSLTGHSNVGVGKYGNDRQTGRLVFSYATIPRLCFCRHSQLWNGCSWREVEYARRGCPAMRWVSSSATVGSRRCRRSASPKCSFPTFDRNFCWYR